MSKIVIEENEWNQMADSDAVGQRCATGGLRVTIRLAKPFSVALANTCNTSFHCLIYNRNRS